MEDLISRQAAIDESFEIYVDGQKFEMVQVETLMGLPSAQPKTDEENELKFYYVESIDDYWIGQRLDNFYYADWHECLGFVWSKSRYLPWGEHIVNENTLWKEHTYPSEPIEIPFTEWIVGFMKKYSADRPSGHWVFDTQIPIGKGAYSAGYRCSICEKDYFRVEGMNFCPNCGAKMVREDGKA